MQYFLSLDILPFSIFFCCCLCLFVFVFVRGLKTKYTSPYAWFFSSRLLPKSVYLDKSLTWPAATRDQWGERSRVEQAHCTPGAVKPYRDSHELADGRISSRSTLFVATTTKKKKFPFNLWAIVAMRVILVFVVCFIRNVFFYYCGKFKKDSNPSS